MIKKLLFIVLILTNIHATIDYKTLSIEQRFDTMLLLSSELETRDELLKIYDSLVPELTKDDITAQDVEMIFGAYNIIQGLYDIYVKEHYKDITTEEFEKYERSVTSIYIKRDKKSLNEVIDIAIFEAKHHVTLTQILLFFYLTSDWYATLMGVSEDTMNKIVKYTTDCANAGNIRCRYELGEAYYHGNNVNQDKVKGLELMLEGADAFPEASYSVSLHYFYEGNMPKFLEYSKLASELGSSKASHNMGIWYLDYQENRTKDDEKKAYDYFILASEQDEENIDNNYDIARCYFYGFGVEHDFQKAKEYSLTVHNSDLVKEEVNISNKRMLGEIYWYIGENAINDKEYKEAFESFTKGSELNNSDNVYALAKMYFNGQYVEKDIQKVVELYKKAADLGHTDAKFWYAYRLFLGDGVDKDEIKGIDMMIEVASINHGLALLVLSDIYYNGSGHVKKDLIKARDYLDKALSHNKEHIHNDALRVWNQRYPNDIKNRD